MRTIELRALLLFALLAVLIAPAARAEQAPPPTRAVQKLARALEEGEGNWSELFALYSDAKKAIAEAQDENEKKAAEELYDAIQGKAAKALARDHVPASGWAMGTFAALLLWGGFFYCLRIAFKSTPEHELEKDETWPLRPEEHDEP
jgi:hypothetical protein